MARADFPRIFLNIAVILNWDIENIDVDTVFLYGEIDHEIYNELSEKLNSLLSYIGRLLKSLYGLK